MAEQTLSINPGHSLYIFTPLGLIRVEMTTRRKLKFHLPAGTQAFRPDKLERMTKELSLVEVETRLVEGEEKAGLVPVFRFLVPLVDENGFLAGVASADDAMFTLVEGSPLPQPETEGESELTYSERYSEITPCEEPSSYPVGGPLKKETKDVPTQT